MRSALFINEKGEKTMKKTTKLLSLLLAVCMLVGIVPLAANGTYATASVNLNYHFGEADNLNSTVASISAYSAVATWEDENGQPYQTPWSARKGDEYHAFIMVAPKDGFELANNLTVKFNGVTITHNAYNNYTENTYCWKEMGTKIELHVAFRYLSADTFGDYSASISTSMPTLNST